MIRSAPFLRAYALFPHRAINGACARAARVERPAWLVDAATRAWVRRDGIDLSDFEPRRYDSLEDFFLRRLRPGARPIGDGLVAPVDGTVMGAGAIADGSRIAVKGRPMSLDRLVNGGGRHDLDLSPFAGGVYLTLFLRPKGYHYVHAPLAGEIVDVRWIPGRFFPQNEDALDRIDRVYERNERAVLRLRTSAGPEILMVMVAASVVGGIHVRGIDDVKQPGAIPLQRGVAKGDEIGHFSFGSTVVTLLPPVLTGTFAPAIGTVFQMGEALAPGPRGAP